jgi:hypothetical protein
MEHVRFQDRAKRAAHGRFYKGVSTRDRRPKMAAQRLRELWK